MLCAEIGEILLELAGPDPERVLDGQLDAGELGAEPLGVVRLEARALAQEPNDEVTARTAKSTAAAETATTTKVTALRPPPRRSASTQNMTNAPTTRFSHAAREKAKRIPIVRIESRTSFVGRRAPQQARGDRLLEQHQGGRARGTARSTFGSLNRPCARGPKTRNWWPGNATKSASTAIAAEKTAAAM